MEPPSYIISSRGKDSGMVPGIKIITLLTDFGLKDPYVGTMKGVILSINPEATIVDITHDVSHQNIEEGAFLIEEYYPFFPAGTIHVGVIDPTVGGNRRPVIINRENQIFIGPDNGLFTLVLGHADVFLIENREFMFSNISSTFHGRDIFAPVAAHTSTGIHPSAFGKQIKDPLRLNGMFPVREGDHLKGRIIRFDRFGNAITNIRHDFLKDFIGQGPFKIRLGNMVFETLNKSYYEADLTCLVGSSGYLEFGYFKGSFKEKTGVNRDSTILISVCTP